MIHRFLLLLLLSSGMYAQSIEMLNSASKASLRGISVVDANNVWFGGTGGTVLRSADGGSTWSNVGPPGALDVDFRGVEAFDANTAYVMGAGSGPQSRIYKTMDGGKHWRQQFITFEPKYFFDCISFWDRVHGIAIGDPIGRHFEVLLTNDAGEHWNPVVTMPDILESETAYATGSCIVTLPGTNDVWFGTGGKSGARVFHSADRAKTWSVVSTPITASNAGMGIFAMTMSDGQNGIAVGGDYNRPDFAETIAAITHNGGRTWTATASQPPGYRCGVAIRPGSSGKTIITVGTSGVDLTEDAGAHWRSLSKERWHSVAFTPDGTMAYVIGQSGRIGRIPFKSGPKKS